MMKTEKIKCEFQFPLITSLEIAQNPLLEKVNGLGVVFFWGGRDWRSGFENHTLFLKIAFIRVVVLRAINGINPFFYRF